MDIWTLWYPTYWLSGCIKAITAIISLYTASELIPLIPKALALPSSAQLEAANRELEREISIRKQAELALQEREAMLRRISDNLPNGAIYKVIREVDGNDRFSYISAGIERLIGSQSRRRTERFKFALSPVYPRRCTTSSRQQSMNLGGISRCLIYNCESKRPALG